MSSLDSITTLDELKDHFEKKVVAVQSAVDVACSLKDPEIRRLHSQIHSDLTDLEAILDKLDLERQNRKKYLKYSEGLMEKAKKLNDAIESSSSTKTNLVVPAPQRVSAMGGIPQGHSGNGKVSINEYLEIYETEAGYSRNMMSSSSKDDIKIHPTFLLINEMSYVGESDFAKIPSYQKGRLTLEKVNSVVDALNQACSAKYEIMRTQKSKQTEKTRATMREYRLQETKETKDFNFITDKDITEFTDLKLDKCFARVITILRTCRRLKEIRGNNLLRYAFLNRL